MTLNKQEKQWLLDEAAKHGGDLHRARYEAETKEELIFRVLRLEAEIERIIATYPS